MNRSAAIQAPWPLVQAFRRLPARFHLALGQASMVVTLLLVAHFAGLVPDRDGALRAQRATLAEAVAMQLSLLLQVGPAPDAVAESGEGQEAPAPDGAANAADDAQPGAAADARLKAALDFVIGRHPDLLAVGLRRADGRLVLRAGRDDLPFDAPADGRSTETHVRVPLLQGGQVWGQAELRFAPIVAAGPLPLPIGGPAQLVAAMGLASFVLFYLYLRRMLRHLDPSNAIPTRVRTAFDTLAEGLLVLDGRGHIALANQAFARVTGQSPEQLVGQPAADLGWIRPPGAGLPWQGLAADAPPRLNTLLQLPDAQGQPRSFRVNVSPVPGADGQPAGTLVSLDDVTELQAQELALRLARDQADAANRAKSDFLANMSHEIRTPMNAVLGFAELLRRSWPTDAAVARRHLDTILGSGRHLLALINDILDLSKVEAGHLEVERVPCAVHTLVQEVAEILRVRAQEKGIGLEVEFPSALPARVLTDPARVRQIVTNLVGNALKFTQQGQVTVRVRIERHARPDALLTIEVSDTGIGIPRDRLEAIFDPFVQAEASTTRQYGGTGLGLSISRRFARALGGDVVAESRPGQGSTFRVTLDTGPLDGADWLEPPALRSVPTARRDDAAPLRWRFPPRRVLVVDDGAENRELVRLVLQDTGLEVLQAENGALGVQAVERDAPDLVLMDVQMPVMDGYTATRTLRERGHALPILALTANAMKGFESEIEAAGFTGYLTKPVDIDALLARLAEWLGGEARAEAVQAPGRPPDPSDPMLPSLPIPSIQSTGPAARTGPAAPAGAGMPVLKTGAPVQRAAGPPIASRLAGHARLAGVARRFALGLPDKLAEMRSVLQAARFDDLAALAHWLKGAGGTVGFDDFFEPARRLEQQAQAGDGPGAAETLAALQALAARIQIPEQPAADAAAAEHDACPT